MHYEQVVLGVCNARRRQLVSRCLHYGTSTEDPILGVERWRDLVIGYIAICKRVNRFAEDLSDEVVQTVAFGGEVGDVVCGRRDLDGHEAGDLDTVSCE